MARTDSGYVYVIGNVSAGLYKIGISNKPDKRLKSIQSHNAIPLDLLAQRAADNARAEEKRLHIELVAYRERGEWFKLVPEQITALFSPNELVGLRPKPKPRIVHKVEPTIESDFRDDIPQQDYDSRREMLRQFKRKFSKCESSRMHDIMSSDTQVA